MKHKVNDPIINNRIFTYTLLYRGLSMETINSLDTEDIVYLSIFEGAYQEKENNKLKSIFGGK